MNPVRIIQAKRDGNALEPEQIREFIAGLATGEVADYQATAFLMAVYFRGMSPAETVALTQAMVDSGVRYDLSQIPGPKVDKHSTGGVGDKVSLILAPLAAACGLKVPMMSGRGLGHTAGTLDKLEAIPGFDVNLPLPRFKQLLSEIGCAMIGQSADIAPADKKLYALRDVTGTVECIPLIVASILSKKIAEGTDGLVLDVKVGSGAFMKTRREARSLAMELTRVGKKLGLRCRTLLTDMSQPLGYAIGHSLEVIETIEVLRNASNGTSCDLKELTTQLCAQMLHLGGIVKNVAEGRKLSQDRLADGSAWKVFLALVKAQSGNLAAVENTALLPRAKKQLEWKARKRGYLSSIDTETLGRILVELGGGRKKASDSIDPSVGLVIHRKLGSKVALGDRLVTVHASERGDLGLLEEEFHRAVTISGTRKPVPKLVLETIQ